MTPNIDFHQRSSPPISPARAGRAKARCDSTCCRARPAKPRASWSRNTTSRPRTITSRPMTAATGCSARRPRPATWPACTTPPADLDGNIWIVYSRPSRVTSYARIDAKTGAVKHFTLPDRRGIVAGSHGIVRDENGILWFNIRSHVQRGHGGLAKLDPRTEKLDIYVPPTDDVGNGGYDRRRHEGQHLGHVAGRRAALQHRRGAVHRVQIGDLQEQARHRHRLWPRRRRRRQRLVAADDAGPRQLQRHHDRQDRTSSSCRRSRR